MSKQANPGLIGAFALGGGLLLLVFVLIIAGGSLFSDRSRFVIVFDGAINGLTVGSNVMFRGVPIGYVSSIEVMADYTDMTFTVPVYVEINNQAIKAVQGERFDEAEVIRGLIQQGLRAELSTESFITGKLFVQLDFHPDSPVILRSTDGDVREIPSIQSGIQAVIASAQSLLQRLQAEVDIDAMLRNFAGAMEGLDTIANSTDLHAGLAGFSKLMNDHDTQQVGAELNRTLDELRDTLRSTRLLVTNAQAELNPLTAQLSQSLEQTAEVLTLASAQLRDDTDLAYRLGTALREIEQAARSFRVLAEYLQQDPNALIRGKEAASN